MADHDSFLTIEDICQLFGRSRTSVYMERSRGAGLGVLGVQVGRRLYWRRSDIDEWFDRQLASSAGAAR